MIETLLPNLGIFIIALFSSGCVALISLIKLSVKDGDSLTVEKINNLLPQTQCGQCGYPGCKPYAQALAKGDDINKCVPGGIELVEVLADVLGTEKPNSKIKDIEEPLPKFAFINEEDCIGCTKCVKACPVDAIIGSVKLMHTVIYDYCTGCDLCIPVCPTECIELLEESEIADKLKKPYIISKSI